jgi:hypothetical protein
VEERPDGRVDRFGPGHLGDGRRDEYEADPVGLPRMLRVGDRPGEKNKHHGHHHQAGS